MRPRQRSTTSSPRTKASSGVGPRPLGGDSTVGEQLLVYFPKQEQPSAVMQVLEDTPDQVTWCCVDCPEDWRDTVISFSLNPTADGGTTLLFTHGPKQVRAGDRRHSRCRSEAAVDL